MAESLFRIEYAFDKGQVFRKKVVSMRKDLRDLRWAWGFVGMAVVEYHRRIFDSEGATSLVSGGPWKPLAELTVLARLRGEKVSNVPNHDYLGGMGEGPEGRILHWSHRLREAMVGNAGTGDSVRVSNRLAFTYGVKGIPYAPLHQDGGVNQWNKNVPPRPFLDPVGGAAVAIGVFDLALQARWGRL